MSLPLFINLYQRLLFFLPLASEYFNYDDPSQWFAEHPHCLGFRQSPISINTHKAHVVHLAPLLLGHYDDLLDDFLHVHNNGHTIHFKVPNTILGERPFITGGLLESVYVAEEVHFHWGSPHRKGSEHMLNGRRYDMEMHIVHRNVNYANVPAARNFDDGLAVIAILFKVVKSPNVYFPGLNEIYTTLEHVSEFNTTISTSHLITLGSLLGNINREEFFTYRGSLTTPPCSEAVTWHIFSEAIPISYTELPKFWNMLDSRGLTLRNNFRPLQSLQFRKVYYQLPIHTTNYLI